MEKKIKTPSLYAERKFDLLEINWKIESVFLCNETDSICSAKFITREPEKTEWLMVLKSKLNFKKSNFITFTLKRLNSDAGPGKAWVDFRITVLDINHIKLYENTELCCFTKDYIDELKFKFKLKQVHAFQPDFLTVACDMIIYGEGTCNIVQECSNFGLKWLSEDMLNLYESSKFHDIELKIEGNTIFAHKPILRSRCEKLNKEIENRNLSDSLEDTDEMTFTNLKYEGMRKIIPYLYSGNLEHILERPSLAIYDCVKVLNIRELESYYTPDKITFRSSMETKEFTFKWNIENISEVCLEKVCLSSPVFKEFNYNTTWQFNLLPKDENAYVIGINAHISQPESLNVCLQCDICDDDDGMLYRSDVKTMSLKHLQNLKMVGLTFVDIEDFSCDDYILHVIFRLKIFEDVIVTSLEKMEIACLTKTVPNSSFKLLSLDLEILLEEASYSDGVAEVVVDGVSQIRYPIHKCILAARSTVFSDLLSLDGDLEPLKISDFKPDTFCSILNYIYSGIFPKHIKDVTEISKAAVFFKLPLLKEFCDRVCKKQKEY